MTTTEDVPNIDLDSSKNATTTIPGIHVVDLDEEFEDVAKKHKKGQFTVTKKTISGNTAMV